ncbi:MAG TPA: AmmeMemoRadiSam system protein B [Actinomycetaceae bacterium]|nr:AmmeMemoRadiSam system protein B [Actinomycetaceae bacterium]
MSAVRPPAVAGLFYPADPRDLADEVRSLIAAVDVPDGAPAPKAVIAPHAGYVYSGSTAAVAYAHLARAAALVRRIILLGPTHRVAVRGMALPGVSGLATPLGVVTVDGGGTATAGRFRQVVTRPDVHAQEHSLEVHLPFLQTVFEGASVVPFAVGDVRPGAVADVLEALWGGDETVVVVSSDLSHYLPYETAREADSRTLARITDLDPDLGPHDACGARPVNGLLALARRRGMTATVLRACNSGDTAGDRRRVVGYAAVAFEETA